MMHVLLPIESNAMYLIFTWSNVCVIAIESNALHLIRTR